MSDLDREPIFWTSTRPGYNNRDREKVRFENGKRVVERVPQRGHQGDYDDRKPARGIRAVTVVGHDGHAISCVLTNAAAHLDHLTPFGQYQQAKWRYFGWYPVGSCPLARLANGEMKADHFHAQSILKDRPCEPGSYNEKDRCKHSLAEEAARKKSRAAENADNETKWRDPQEKVVDATKAQTEAIVKALLDAKGAK
jgi:hypothetical protein